MRKETKGRLIVLFLAVALLILGTGFMLNLVWRDKPGKEVPARIAFIATMVGGIASLIALGLVFYNIGDMFRVPQTPLTESLSSSSSVSIPSE